METKFSRKIAEVYDAWAPTYDTETNPALIAEGNRSIDALELNEEDVVLEVGCGTGRNLKKMVKKTKNIHGIDISEEMINVAKTALPDVDFKEGDIETGLPYCEKTFDKVLCSFVISHIKNIDSLFSEIGRVLKKNGLLVITTIHPAADFSKFEPKEKRFHLMKHDINLQHNLEEITKACEISGLKICEVKEIPIFEGLRQYYTEESFKKIRGTPFLVIIKAKKNSVA